MAGVDSAACLHAEHFSLNFYFGILIKRTVGRGGCGGGGGGGLVVRGLDFDSFDSPTATRKIKNKRNRFYLQLLWTEPESLFTRLMEPTFLNIPLTY